MPEIMNWEAVYRQQGFFEGPPPWNIGEPQPEIAALIRAGKIRGKVLDAGCGVAEASLELAARGHTVVGVDTSRTAVALATKAAAERGLSSATFVHSDITKFSGHDGEFDTIIDSTLFHSLPVELRDAYLRAVHAAAAPGALFFVLVFTAEAFPADSPLPMPNLVTEAELREAVSKYWVIDEIRPADIYSYLVETSPKGATPETARDEKVLMKMPAFLLAAHKAI